MSSIKGTQIDGDVSVGRNVAIGGKTLVQDNAHFKSNVRVDGWLEANNVNVADKGLFKTEQDLETSYPDPKDGWWALVGNTIPANVYIVQQGKWVATGEKGSSPTILAANIKVATMSLAEYKALPEKEEDIYYFTYEEED